VTMALSPPGRSATQRVDALAYGNRLRSRRAQLKRDVRARRVDAREILSNPPEWVLGMKVVDLMLAIPKLGRIKTNRVFANERISPSKTIGGLSERQRDALVGVLGRWV